MNNFRERLISFLKDELKENTNSPTYINPHLLVGIANAIDETTENHEEADFIYDWATEMVEW